MRELMAKIKQFFGGLPPEGPFHVFVKVRNEAPVHIGAFSHVSRAESEAQRWVVTRVFRSGESVFADWWTRAESDMGPREREIAGLVPWIEKR